MGNQVADSDAIAQARQALGRQLAQLRKAAGHTQSSFAPLISGYSRSTLANAETGARPAGRSFWEQCDKILATGGVLAQGFDQVEAARQDNRKLEARQAQAEREERIRQQRAAARSEARSLLERMAGEQAGGAGDPALAAPLGLPALPLSSAADRPADQAYVESVRQTAQRLVALDGQHGGDDIAALAVRAFRSVHHRLGTGAYQPKIERDLHAAAGELAEVAGWLLYDADQHAASRQLNQEALFYARLAGDQGMEHLILNNIGNQSVKLHRVKEGLAIARQLLETGPASSRMQALFRIREARALAKSGQGSEARDAFARARSLFLDGVSDDDPPWAWWISEAELTVHEGLSYANLGDWSRAADLTGLAVEITPMRLRRDRYSHTVSHFEALVRARAWKDAEAILPTIISSAYEVGSRRTVVLLSEVIKEILADKATPELRDGARHLREVLQAAGYGEE